MFNTVFWYCTPVIQTSVVTHFYLDSKVGSTEMFKHVIILELFIPSFYVCKPDLELQLFDFFGCPLTAISNMFFSVCFLLSVLLLTEPTGCTASCSIPSIQSCKARRVPLELAAAVCIGKLGTRKKNPQCFQSWSSRSQGSRPGFWNFE